ncbi:capsid assembly scaffolding protein Gp46 family protein [Nonomuraea basaltis]|uniref:capsid assembly scaffolding protein Gp46 family protein n=1 Tax=Nonomuraea basaltis TaxID=2495887 RepID=UPI00110C5098|nr:DUF4355 domain-containing protein [Nonomuraea basaltis]TMS00183.1 hypothetical protein EJK15_03670 [Nonomuraea basaltis]
MSEPTPAVDVEQMLAEAVSTPELSAPESQAQEPDTGTAPKDWQAEATKWKSLARKHESTAKTHADAAKRLAEIEDAQKTEQQRLQEQATAAEQRATKLQAANARLLAAATYGIPADLIDLLGDGDEEQINERARLLAERLAAAVPPPASTAPVNSRPVESLKPGAAPAASEPDPDAWLRRMAGRT